MGGWGMSDYPLSAPLLPGSTSIKEFDASTFPFEAFEISSGDTFPKVLTLKENWVLKIDDGSSLVVETIKAFDSTGLKLFEDGGTKGITIDDSGYITGTEGVWYFDDRGGWIGNTGANEHIVNNAYYSGGWKYRVTDEASLIGLNDDGTISFFTAASGTAGNTISFDLRMQLMRQGLLSIKAGTWELPTYPSLNLSCTTTYGQIYAYGASGAIPLHLGGGDVAFFTYGSPDMRMKIHNDGMVSIGTGCAITSAPTSAHANNLGWKLNFYSTDYAMGIANYSWVVKTGGWFSHFVGSNPANNASTTWPDSNASVTLGSNGNIIGMGGSGNYAFLCSKYSAHVTCNLVWPGEWKYIRTDYAAVIQPAIALYSTSYNGLKISSCASGTAGTTASSFKFLSIINDPSTYVWYFYDSSQSKFLAYFYYYASGTYTEFSIYKMKTTTDSTYPRLQVSGTWYTLLYYSSSERYKRDIVDVPKSAKDIVLKLRPRFYRSRIPTDDQDKLFCGFIAEEAEIDCGAHVDSFLQYSKDDQGNYTVESVEPASFVPLIVSVVQDHEARIKALEEARA